MVYFQTKNPTLGKLWWVLHWKMLINLCIYILYNHFGQFFGHLVYFVCYFGIFCVTLIYFVLLWYILCYFGIFCVTLVYFVVIWYNFPVLVHCTTKNLATLNGRRERERNECDRWSKDWHGERREWSKTKSSAGPSPERSQIGREQGDQGPMLWFFKNIFAKKFCEKIDVFDSKQS
jgi:hypothetical protein